MIVLGPEVVEGEAELQGLLPELRIVERLLHGVGEDLEDRDRPLGAARPRMASWVASKPASL